MAQTCHKCINTAKRGVKKHSLCFKGQFLGKLPKFSNFEASTFPYSQVKHIICKRQAIVKSDLLKGSKNLRSLD